MGAGPSLGPFPAPLSVVVGQDRDGADIRRAPSHKDELMVTAMSDVTTLYEAFRRGVRVSGDGPCYGTRPMAASLGAGGAPQLAAGPYEWLSYNQVAARVDALGAGMLHFELAPPNADALRLAGIFSKNRAEYCIVINACYSYGMSDVPLYDTLGDEAVAFILEQTGLKAIFTGAESVRKLAELKLREPRQCARFAAVVQWEETKRPEDVAACAKAGLTLHSMAEVEAAGRAHPAPHTPPKPTDLAYICYTSGTTGMPKGVMIKHRMQVCDASGAFTHNLGIVRSDSHLSYLPLAHSFERLVQCALYMAGASMGFYQGDTLKILEDLKALRPTVFCSVPRLYNRIYERITAGVEAKGGVAKMLFNHALEAKKANLGASNVLSHALWDRLVFKAVGERVGLDRCKLMLTGSAPIAPHVMEFLRVVFGAHVCEGYGQTECSAAATLTCWSDQATKNHVGGPLAGNEVKLCAVPDMGYLPSDTAHDRQVDAATGAVLQAGDKCFGRGEVCYRGANVFSGYYRDPERTAEALDADGWLHSGDIGIWDANGCLRIVDRKKNMFKLSQGEYVAAEKIEIQLAKSAFVSAIWVHGDSLHSFLVAVVVPNADTAAQWAKETPGKAALDLAALCADEDFKKAVLADLSALGKANKLQGFELPRDLHLEAAPWLPENDSRGLLTPTFKLKRLEARKYYQYKVDAMYAKESIGGVQGLKQK